MPGKVREIEKLVRTEEHEAVEGEEEGEGENRL